VRRVRLALFFILYVSFIRLFYTFLILFFRIWCGTEPVIGLQHNSGPRGGAHAAAGSERRCRSDRDPTGTTQVGQAHDKRQKR
jgi:uncharacterized membrane protein